MDHTEKSAEERNLFFAKSVLQRSPPSPLSSPITKEPKIDNLKTMSTRSQSCKICRVNLGLQSIISCHCCNESYHTSCIGHTDNFVSHFLTEKRTPFVCFACMNNGTHYKTYLERYYTEMENSLTTKLQESIRLASSSVFEMFKNELETHKTYMNNELEKLRIETDSRFEQMEQKLSHSPVGTTVTTEKISALQEEINYLHAKVREKNLIISGVSEETELSLTTIIERVGNLYNTRIRADQINSIQRLKAAFNPSQSHQNKPEQPPNILIEFNNETVRNELFNNYLSAIRAKKSHPCSAIGINSSKTIYINEHLPKYILEMKNKARLIQKAGGFDAVIARPQHISVKKGETWIKISTTEQMDSLIASIGAPK